MGLEVRALLIETGTLGLMGASNAQCFPQFAP